jgi:hypothetical protein
LVISKQEFLAVSTSACGGRGPKPHQGQEYQDKHLQKEEYHYY